MPGPLRGLLLCCLLTACSFQRPPALAPDDAPEGPSDAAPPDAQVGCDDGTRTCSGATPYCLANACVACATSANCSATSPVCDDTSRSCRVCAKDSECDSGACDLAAGTCVDRSAILYASAGGTDADPCTVASPCSLRRAAVVTDTSHSYIVLTPGHYSGGFTLDGKSVTIVGNASTIEITDETASSVSIQNSSSVAIRNVNVAAGDPIPGSDANEYISVIDSDVNVDTMQGNAFNAYVIASHGASTLTIRNSTIASGSITASGQLSIDRCVFKHIGPSVNGSASITNSIITVDQSSAAVTIVPGSDANPLTTISNNTIIGGEIYCGPNAGAAYFKNNIFYNQSSITTPSTSSSNCDYSYNLVVPYIPLSGTGNLDADPMFVDLANQDFHLRADSPAIHAADPSFVPSGHDFDGVSRPQGMRADIGAFEYVP
jgi:hypothetical protein